MKTTAEAWDAHWTERLGDERGRRRAIEGGRSDAPTSYVSLLRQRNVRRILLPGNGCFLLAHALVHVGFEVVVVDISPVATNTVNDLLLLH